MTATILKRGKQLFIEHVQWVRLDCYNKALHVFWNFNDPNTSWGRDITI